MQKNYIKSPLNYVGGKTKLLPQILPLFPNLENFRFIDLFCGGGNVAVNTNAKSIIANDLNDKVIGIYRAFQSHSVDEIIGYVKGAITKYGLNMTDPLPFNSFRKDYNEGARDPLDLFILICFSFNHQIRFNSKGEYNMPFGKDRSQYNGTIEKIS